VPTAVVGHTNVCKNIIQLAQQWQASIDGHHSDVSHLEGSSEDLKNLVAIIGRSVGNHPNGTGEISDEL